MTRKRKEDITPRLAAWRVLHSVLEKGAYSHKELQQLFQEHPSLSSRDRAFIERLVRGTIEHLYELDACINQVSRLPVHKLKPGIRTVLRMSVYQMRYMDRVPFRAVCNEAVNLTAGLGFFSLKGYVNGVLRGLDRLFAAGYQPFDPEGEAGPSPSMKQLSLRYSMPEWLIRRYQELFGREKTGGILEAMGKPVKLSVYANPGYGSLDFLQKQLEAEEVDCTPLPYGLSGFYVNAARPLEELSAFKKGGFLIQDVSSMLQGKITAARKGQYIVDVCAAPGGKTFHAAMDMEGSGCVDSRDVSDAKIALIRDQARRLGLNHVRIQKQDARKLDPSLIEKADVVIADLPCSGLGIIGRKPEIRYNIKESDIAQLASLQREILNVVWQYVKPGGRLIYSTCTLTREEDEENYRYITEKLPFDPESLEPYLTEGPFADTLKEGYLKLVPGLQECDGFFIGSAVRRKTDD